MVWLTLLCTKVWNGLHSGYVLVKWNFCQSKWKWEANIGGSTVSQGGHSQCVSPNSLLNIVNLFSKSKCVIFRHGTDFQAAFWQSKYMYYISSCHEESFWLKIYYLFMFILQIHLKRFQSVNKCSFLTLQMLKTKGNNLNILYICTF